MKFGIGYQNEKDAMLSGKNIAEYAIKNGNIDRPDLVLAFCSGQIDPDKFFQGLQSVVGNQTPIIGGSATVGMAGMGFTQGITGVWWLLVGSVGLIILGLFLAKASNQ